MIKGLPTYSWHARTPLDLNHRFTRVTMKNDPSFSENFAYFIINRVITLICYSLIYRVNKIILINVI